MSWFFAVVLVLVVGGFVVVFAGGAGGAAPAYDDGVDAGLPDDRPLTGRDLREVRLNTAVRGYRADEVDDLLARLAQELDERDEQTGGRSGDEGGGVTDR